MTHPGVLDAAVIGIPDRDVGEKVKAYVVKKDNALIEADVVKFVESEFSFGSVQTSAAMQLAQNSMENQESTRNDLA